MGLLYTFAKRLQSLDRFLPAAWRVPVRYHALRLSGGMEKEMRLLPSMVPKHLIAVDVGANMGTYAYALAKQARRVIAFEPIPACAATIRAWGKGRNIDVHFCGLGDTEGSFQLHLPEANNRLVSTRASFIRKDGEGANFEVPVRTLDSFSLEDVGFIKIDVEGFELAVLQGAQQLIERYSPILLVEIDPVSQTSAEFSSTFDWLRQRGYAAHYYARGELAPCDASIQTTRPEIYNFVFIRQKSPAER